MLKWLMIIIFTISLILLAQGFLYRPYTTLLNPGDDILLHVYSGETLLIKIISNNTACYNISVNSRMYCLSPNVPHIDDTISGSVALNGQLGEYILEINVLPNEVRRMVYVMLGIISSIFLILRIYCRTNHSTLAHGRSTS